MKLFLKYSTAAGRLCERKPNFLVQSGPDDKKDVRNGKKVTNIADCFDTLRAKTPRKITRIFRGVEFNKNKTKGLAGLGQLPDQTDQGGDIGFVGVVALVELAAVGLHSGQLVGS